MSRPFAGWFYRTAVAITLFAIGMTQSPAQAISAARAAEPAMYSTTGPDPDADAEASFDPFIGSSPLTITAGATLPDATVGIYYSDALTVTGGTAPYSWSLISGYTPPGTGFDTTGMIFQTPQIAGAFQFTAQVTDATGTSASQAFTLNVRKGQTAFIGTSSQTITFSTSPTTVSGKIMAGVIVPTGSVSITLNGVVRWVGIDPITGAFSTSFDTKSLAVVGSPYDLSFSFAGDSNLAPALYSALLSVTKVPSSVLVSDATSLFSSDSMTVPLKAKVVGFPVTDGNMDFMLMDGTTIVVPDMTAPIQSDGSASFPCPLPAGLAAKAYTIQASYTGGSNVQGGIGVGTLTITTAPSGSVPVSLNPGFGASLTSSGLGTLVSGYGVIISTLSPSPVAVANMSQTIVPSGKGVPTPTLVTEAGVSSASPGNVARFVVNYSSATNSGIALVNPGQAPITVVGYLKSSGGATVASTSITLAASAHTALFVNRLFSPMPNPFLGSLLLTSAAPFVSTSLSTSMNVRGEMILYAVPTVDPTVLPQTSSLVLPQVVDGGGIQTQILLMNPSSTLPSVGSVYLFDLNGAPLNLDFGSFAGTQNRIDFTLNPDGVAQFTTRGEGTPRIGHAVVSVSSGGLPSSFAVFNVLQNSILVSQAGILSPPQTTSARMFVDLASIPRLRTSGISIVNPSAASSAVVTLRLTSSQSVTANKTVVLGPNAQIAMFVDQLFPQQVPPDFVGILDMSSTAPIAATALRMTINERGESIYSTLPVSDLTNPPTGLQYLPHVVNGGGYMTEVILINPSEQKNAVYLAVYNDLGKILSTFAFR